MQAPPPRSPPVGNRGLPRWWDLLVPAASSLAASVAATSNAAPEAGVDVDELDAYPAGGRGAGPVPDGVPGHGSGGTVA